MKHKKYADIILGVVETMRYHCVITSNTFETILEDLTSKMVNTLSINKENEKIFRDYICDKVNNTIPNL
tara:strand:+ start:289 stop:495 length:207 start_codon:yes stop_codon:yes gene_type:complete